MMVAVIVAFFVFSLSFGFGLSRTWAGILAFAALCATVWSCVVLVIGVIGLGVIFLTAHLVKTGF